MRRDFLYFLVNKLVQITLRRYIVTGILDFDELAIQLNEIFIDFRFVFSALVNEVLPLRVTPDRLATG
ncbi:MAG: hypothetical protein ABSA97_08510 [Verrucomicrobiia bacterium]